VVGIGVKIDRGRPQAPFALDYLQLLMNEFYLVKYPHSDRILHLVATLAV
jgi:hypothetical protein